MSQKITHDQKETALEVIKVKGTMVAAAEAVGITVRTLNNEMKRSMVFKRRIEEARLDWKSNVRDKSWKAYNEILEHGNEKSKLIAALAGLNWTEPGFRGTTTIQGRVEYDVRVLDPRRTGIPRPQYPEIESPKVKVIDEGKE